MKFHYCPETDSLHYVLPCGHTCVTAWLPNWRRIWQAAANLLDLAIQQEQIEMH